MSQWRRGVSAPSNCRDPNAYLPKPVRHMVNKVLEDIHHRGALDELRQIVRQRKPFMTSMMVYAIHQCCSSDRLKSCERVVGMVKDDELRGIIVNAPYGKSQYTPLCRAAYCGSEQMIRYLVSCGADLAYRNKHDEGLVDILKIGLEEAQTASAFVRVVVKEKQNRRKKTYYELTFPDGKKMTLPHLRHVTRKKYSAENVGFVESSRYGYNTDNTMFIRERFANCHQYIQKSLSWQAAQHVKKIPKKRFLGKHSAALRIQTWWKGASKVAPVPDNLRVDLMRCESLPIAKIQEFVDAIKASESKQRAVQELYRNDADVKALIDYDLPLLKCLL